jgi:hypothetical protein
MTTTAQLATALAAAAQQYAIDSDEAAYSAAIVAAYTAWDGLAYDTPAGLAQRQAAIIAELSPVNVREFLAWLNGTVNGGTNGDGRYPLTIGGVAVLVYCPAALKSVGDNSGRRLTFSTTTTDADPGAALLRFNNGTLASVTQIFVDLADLAGGDLTAWLDSLDDSTSTSSKGVLTLIELSTAKVWTFKLTAVTTATGYRKLTVSAPSGTGLPGNGGVLAVSFTPTGDAGNVSGSRLVSAAGLATGGGDLTADRTITVTAATNAQAKLGTSTAVAMTPAAELAAEEGLVNILERITETTPTSSNPQAFLAARTGFGFRAAGNMGNSAPFIRKGLQNSTALTDILTLTRATESWGFDQAGTLAGVAAGVALRNTNGLGVFPARTNSIRNPVFTGAVAGTPGTAPTNATFTSSQNGISGRISATGTEYGMPYIELTYSGVASADAFMEFRPDGTTLAAVTGAIWTFASYVRLVSGASPAGQFLTRVFEYDVSNAYLSEGSRGDTLVAGNIPVRLAKQHTMAHASCAKTLPVFTTKFNNGETATAVIRIYAPNFKAGADINDPPILQATNAVATRNADQYSTALAIPAGQAFTIFGRFVAPAITAGNYNPVAEIYGSSSHMIRVFLNSDASNSFAVATTSNGISTTGYSSSGALVAGQVYAWALSVSGSTVTLAVNGAVVLTFTMPGGALGALTTIILGSTFFGASYLVSYIRSQFYDPRAYSTTELRCAATFDPAQAKIDLDAGRDPVQPYIDEDYTVAGGRFALAGDQYQAVTDLPLTTYTEAVTAVVKTNTTTGKYLIPTASGSIRMCDAGLTIEPAETSLDATSEGTAAWTNNTGVTTAASSRTGPRGNTTFYAQVTQSSGADRRAQTNFTVPDNSLPYYVSAFIPKIAGGLGRTLYGQLVGGTGVSSKVEINETTGAVVSSLGTYFVEDYGTAWRLTVVMTNNSTGNTTLVAQFYPGAAGGTAVGDVGGLRAAQGSVPQSYFQTNGGVLTRNFEALTSRIVLPAAFTWVLEFMVPVSPFSAFGWIGGIVVDSNNFIALLLRRSDMKLFLQVNTAGATVANIDLGVVTGGSTHKVAARLVANNITASLNGAAVPSTDTSCALPTAGGLPATLTRLASLTGWGNELGGGGKLRRMRLYDVAKAGASDADLRAL